MLDETVERLEKKSNEPKSITLQYCSIELYQVSDSYDSEQVLQRIKTDCLPPKTAYVIALHDRDVYTEDTFNSYKELIGTKGQKKASHYHILLKLPYRMYRCDIANKLGIEERWILKLKKEQDFDNMIWYVTHEKYEDIQSTL